MSLVIWRKGVLASSILAALMGAAPTASTVAQEKAALPDFSSNLMGWVGLNGGGPYFEADPGRQPGERGSAWRTSSYSGWSGPS